MSEERLPLTVVILTLNEATRMKRCLESLAAASQVVVIDSYSQDGTLEEVKKTWLQMGRNLCDLILVTQEWNGFTKTRNESLKWVREDWVFWVDADEWVEASLWKDLQKQLNHAPSEVSVFFVPRLSFFLGKAIKHGGWYPDRKARLARTKNCEWKSGPHGSDVHEDLYAKDGSSRRPLKTKSHLFHEGFRSVEEQFETNDRYSTLLALGLSQKWKEQNKKAPGSTWIYLKMGIKFLENYFWKLGMLDGYPGYLIAKGSAKSMGMRLSKAKKLLEDSK